MFKKISGVVCAAFLVTLPWWFLSRQESMGKVDFPSAMPKAAQAYFIKGLISLHNFCYEEAQGYFQKAEHMAPKAVLPYWGEAMSYNHPLWDEVDLEGGRQALKKLASTTEGQLQKAQNDKERGLLQAVQALYGDGEKRVRDGHYLKRLHQLFAQNPNDPDLASFYALALLGSTEGQRDFATYLRAAALLREVYKKNSEHPGVIHYAIHALDDPMHASQGLLYARQYAKIAPDASHALHMPSHIFLALGMWEEVIASDKNAWQAGLKHNRQKDPFKYTVHDFHALQWLSYGYLQKLEFKKSFACVKKMEEIVEKNPSPMAKWYYALMRADYITETQDWQASLKSFDMQGVEFNGTANNIYADSLIRLHTEKNDFKASVAGVVATLAKLCKAIPNKNVGHSGSRDYFTTITSAGVVTSKIILLELNAQIALIQQDASKAIQLLQKAAKMEDQTAFGYGPPSPVKPAHELLADVYFESQNYEQARKHYQLSLQRAPNRALSKRGYEKSAALARQ